MRTKVTLVLLFLNVALFFYIFKFERNWNVTPAAATRRVLGPEAADIRALTVTTANHAGEFTLERRQREQWMLTKPLEWPANWPAVSSILNELQLLESERHFPREDLAKSGMGLKDYGLEPQKMTLAFRSGESGAATELKIGDTTNDGKRLYVLSTDGKLVHVVARSLIDSLTRPLEQLRADALLTVPVFEARSLLIITGSDDQSRTAGAPRVRMHREANNRWSFDAPINAAASKLAIDTTVKDLGSLHAKSFPATPPAVLPSVAPTLRVMLEGNGRRETLFLGEAVGPASKGTQEFFGQLEGRNAVFTVAVPVSLLDRLRNAQVELRERRLLWDIEPRAVSSVELRAPVTGQPPLTLQRLDSAPNAPEAGWQVFRRAEGAQAPQTIAGDPDLVLGLLGKLTLLTAKAFESDAPNAAQLEDWGFNRPERELVITFSGGLPPRRVQFGTDVARNVHVRLGSGDTLGDSVYAVDAEILRELSLEPMSWRQRLVQELPSAARVVGLKLVDLSHPEKPLLDVAFDPAGQPTAPVAHAAAVNTLVASVRRLHASRFAQASFSERVAAADDEPWRYQLEAKVQLPGAAAEQTSTLTLFFTKRMGGAQQYAGSREMDAVVAIEQPLIDALWPLTEGAKDPGPPALVEPKK